MSRSDSRPQEHDPHPHKTPEGRSSGDDVTGENLEEFEEMTGEVAREGSEKRPDDAPAVQPGDVLPKARDFDEFEELAGDAKLDSGNVLSGFSLPIAKVFR